MDEAPRTWVDRLPLMVLAVLAAGFLALGVAEARADAPTFDEPVYVSAGLAAVLHHDVTLNDEHPPLPKVLAVLPVLFAHPVVPGGGRWSGNDELRYGARFVAAQLAAGKLRSVTFASRLIPLAETAAVAFALFGIAAELAGLVAGLLAGALWPREFRRCSGAPLRGPPSARRTPAARTWQRRPPRRRRRRENPAERGGRFPGAAVRRRGRRETRSVRENKAIDDPERAG